MTAGLWSNRAVAAVAIVFGVATVFAGGTALFGGEAARAAAGNAVPFVLWFNFLAGFAYVAAGAGLWRGQAWAEGFGGEPGSAWELPRRPDGCAGAGAVRTGAGGGRSRIRGR